MIRKILFFYKKKQKNQKKQCVCVFDLRDPLAETRLTVYRQLYIMTRIAEVFFSLKSNTAIVVFEKKIAPRKSIIYTTNRAHYTLLGAD